MDGRIATKSERRRGSTHWGDESSALLAHISRSLVRLVLCPEMGIYTGLGKRVVPRLSELTLRDQRESEGRIHATQRPLFRPALFYVRKDRVSPSCRPTVLTFC